MVVEEASSPLDDRWGAMTFPLYRSLLPLLGTGADAQGARPIACRALADGEPAGLVLAQRTAAAPASAEILSVFVPAAFRGQGIATRLVECLEQAARERHGVNELTGSYMTGKPGIPAVERVFEKRGFTPPELRMIVLKFTPEEAARTDWYQKARMPVGATIFPWSELSAEEREEMRRSQAETGWIHPDLEPWKCDERFDEVSSVGMRKDGQVVGWVINHRPSPGLVTFTTSFMRRDLARRGAIFPLYVASIERLAGTGVICSFVTNAKFDAMVRFALRRGAPFVHYTGETRGVSKRL